MKPSIVSPMQFVQKLKRDAAIMALGHKLLEIHKRFLETANKYEQIIKNNKGDKGDSPTDGHLLSLIRPLIPIVEDGIDGHTPTEEELLELIIPLIPEVKDGHTPTKKELIDLIVSLIPKVENGHTPTQTELLKLIEPLIPKVDIKEIAKLVKVKKSKEIDADHILSLFGTGKKIPVDFIDGLEQTFSARFHQLARGYLHGGGDTVRAGSNITIVNNNDGTKTITAISSGVGAWSTPPEAPAPNGSILVFTVGATAPTDVVADGITYYAGAGYTYAGTQITFTNGPTQYVRYR